jgi:hypothetical protein
LVAAGRQQVRGTAALPRLVAIARNNLPKPLFCLRNAAGRAIEYQPPVKALDQLVRNLIRNLQKLNQKVK